MERDLVLSGIHFAEHSLESEDYLEQIQKRCIDCGHNVVTIRPPRLKEVPQELFLKWAKYLSDNEVYFAFLYSVQWSPAHRDSHLDKETVAEIKRIAGKYFLGDMIGEVGSDFACKFKHYFDDGKETIVPDTTLPDMATAHAKYIDFVGKWIQVDKDLEMPATLSVEATGLNRYNAEAGVDFPMLELMCGNPEILVPSLRGTARATNAPFWGTYLAHEWYGGYRHLDPLKRKRMDVALRYAYLSGSNAIILESGDEFIDSFGDYYTADHEICREYRENMMRLTKFVREDHRPAGGPKVKVAFVQGNHDSWSGGWGGSSVWNQFDRPEWGYNEAEHSWWLMEELNRKRSWHDTANFGDADLSAVPAYGSYDVIPAEAPVELYKSYDYLIFLGWNSMTDELYDKLLAFVENGGKLLMTAAHLNYSTRRDGEKIYLDNEKMEKLFGCRFTGETVLTNGGVKFLDKSISGLVYPGTKDRGCDPICSAGYVSYLKCVPTTGYAVGDMCEEFENVFYGLPFVIENNVGKGTAILVTSANYPGHSALVPLYRTIMREMISNSARNCELQVLSATSLRYAVYEGGKMYLLNTDFDVPVRAEIRYQGKTSFVDVNPMELKTFQL